MDYAPPYHNIENEHMQNDLGLKDRQYDCATPDITEGDLIMFPSYLMHEVKANKPTPGNPRISIAFNFAVTQYSSCK